MANARESCLIVILKEEMVLVATSECPSESFVFESNYYKDIGYGDFTGFYDWLRNNDDQIIGVRYYPFKELEFLCDAIEHLSYIVIEPKTKILSLYFSDDHGAEQYSSDDQDFGDNRVYKSDAGEYAISFNAYGFFSYSGIIVDSLSAEVANKCRFL